MIYCLMFGQFITARWRRAAERRLRAELGLAAS
jgi:hypothetical protein